MIKQLIILMAILATAQGYEDAHTDIIMQVYNETCVETANYQYAFINMSWVDLEEVGDIPIAVAVIEQLGPKSVLVDLYYYDIIEE